MKLRITVHGVAYDVDVEVLDAGDGFPGATGPLPSRQPTVPTPAGAPISASPIPQAPQRATGGGVACPIAGTVLELRCKVGDQVSSGQVVAILEAMKMKTNITAPTGGTVKGIPVAVGDSVREGQILVELD